MRSLFSLIAAAAMLAAPARSQAQFAVYVTSTNINASNVASGTTTTSTNTQTVTSSYWTSGIGGGVTMNFLPLHFLSLGLDARGSTKSGTNGVDTGLVGIKLGIHPPLLRAKPYVQGSAGYLATRTFDASVPAGPTSSEGTTATDTHQFLAYGVLGGVDYPLLPLIDFRVEAGFLKGDDVGNKAFGGTALPAPNLFLLITGLVLHF
jgi:hypothetical protein